MSTAQGRASSRPAPGPPLAVIDIGTNSTKLLVARVRAGRVECIHFDRATTRIGEALEARGRIGAAAARRTAQTVRRFAATARRLGSRDTVAVGTYAFRAAANGRRVARAIAREAGVPVRVLTGREEATFSFLSARARLLRPRVCTMLIDVGGGSTELIVAMRGRLRVVRSLPLGALRLTERYLHSDPIQPGEHRALVRRVETVVHRALSGVPCGSAGSIDLVACGGSATTGVDMARLGRARDFSRFHTLSLARALRLERLCLERTVADRRRIPGLPADRADIIPAGLAVLIAFMRRTGQRAVRVSDGGVREGVILAYTK